MAYHDIPLAPRGNRGNPPIPLAPTVYRSVARYATSYHWYQRYRAASVGLPIGTAVTAGTAWYRW